MAKRRTNIDELIQTFAETLADAVREQVRDAVVTALAAEIGSSGGHPEEAPSPRRTANGKRANNKVRGQGRAAENVAPGRRGRRSPAELDLQKKKVLELLAAQPDLRAEEIGRALEMQGKGLAPLLRSLAEDGLLVRSGVARGTRYRRTGDKAAVTLTGSARSADTAARRDKKIADKASDKRAASRSAAKPAKQRLSKQGKATKKATQEASAKEQKKVTHAASARAKQQATQAGSAKEARTDNASATADAGPPSPANGATYASRASSEAVAKSPPPHNGSAPRDLTAEAIRWIQNNPGDTSSIIAEALQTSSTRVRAILQPLIEEGVIERQGDGRGATYAAR